MKRLFAALLAGAVLFSGCSSSGKTTETVELFPSTTTIESAEAKTKLDIVLETAPLADHSIPDYAASEDTFSFQNFGGGEAPADLTVNMARRLYGDSQVCSDVTDGKCTPYPVILQLMSQANKSM